MSTVHLVGGEKGGVGKSVVARLLSQLFIDRGLAFAALDADQSHGALRRSYAEFTQSVDLERLESADQILDRALGAERRVVVDLPAQSHRALRRWIDATDLLTYAREMGVAFLACGHHATERFGAPAVAGHVAAQLGLAHEFIDIDNPA